MAVRRRISLRRFKKGGEAILVAEAINQHIVMLGTRVIKPLVRKRLRVFVVSLVIPAREKRAGEERPWASIIESLPAQPQEVIEATPATIRPI